AAQRAKASAEQQGKIAARLAASMALKREAAQKKINLLNSKVFAKAMAVFKQTGNYPNINIPTANTIGAQALRLALTKRGDPYVWGAAGPSSFDCSGLVLWAYGQVGISLPHFTGDQWNMGVHVARADLQPGDLVFFYPDIGHVGLYIGNGLMVDAPNFGETVQVERFSWDASVGAVRIVGGPTRHPLTAQPGSSGRTIGNRIVSRMLSPVIMIRIRSMPAPIPPDGGMPYSSARRKSSSTCI